MNKFRLLFFSKKSFVILSLIFFIQLSCSSPAKENADPQKVTIMTFNVENLFDTKDDPNKNDETFLPRTLKNTKKQKDICAQARFPKWVDQCLNWDWNEKVVETKLSRLAKVFKQVNKGQGPDFVLLQEVENKEILERLNKEYQLGFKEIVLIEGRDVRGIDTAILSKYPIVGEPQLHYVKFKNVSKDRVDDSRGILQADFKINDQQTVTLFSAHFPAPFHPVEMRVQSLQKLSELLKNLPLERLVVAGGDFNIPIEEDQSTQILNKYAAPYWFVAHKEGNISEKGTTYYPKNKTWSFLDILLIKKASPNLAKWQWDRNSVRVINSAPQQKDKMGYPQEFDPEKLTGVSDHWPLAIDVLLEK